MHMQILKQLEKVHKIVTTSYMVTASVRRKCSQKLVSWLCDQWSLLCNSMGLSS